VPKPPEGDQLWEVFQNPGIEISWYWALNITITGTDKRAPLIDNIEVIPDRIELGHIFCWSNYNSKITINSIIPNILKL